MNFGRFFNEHSGKQIKVTMTDGEVLEGKLDVYISELDNEPDPECIMIYQMGAGLVELPTNEIASVELVTA